MTDNGAAQTTDPEEFADEAGVGPTPQEVDQYVELAQEQPPWSDPDEH